MKKLSLIEIKKFELDLLKRFDVFCKENGIRYFLSNGTLLGAIKYGGFIPWDDDVDVLVPREDYDRLISLFADDGKFQLFSFERNPNYRFPFAKLCDMTTKKEEGNIDNGVILGLDIDIFPLDAWDSDLERAKSEINRIQKKMFYLGLSKLRKPDSVNPLKRAVKGIVMFFCKVMGSAHFIREIIKESNQPKQKGSPYVGCKSWCIYGDREIIPAEVFAKTVEITFEDGIFPAPVGYDAYLRSLYGDYEKDPPADQQRTHHNFEAVEIG